MYLGGNKLFIRHYKAAPGFPQAGRFILSALNLLGGLLP
jgi:hypothetical protein